VRRNHDAVFTEQAADLVRQLGSAANQPAAYTVNALHILLPDALSRNKLHVRSADCLADRCRIIGIVLRPILQVGFDKLWRNQSDRVPERCKYTRPEMRTSGRFDSNHTGWQVREEVCQLSSPKPFP
jgi:hypothetical protein